jgi:hypothetical protein
MFFGIRRSKNARRGIAALELAGKGGPLAVFPRALPQTRRGLGKNRIFPFLGVVLTAGLRSGIIISHE